MKRLMTIVLVAAAIMTSCTTKTNKSKSSVDLPTDQTAQSFFNKEELNVFNQLITFVDQEVLKQTALTDINAAYHQYFKDMDTKIKKKENPLPLFKDVDKIKFLKNLDQTPLNSAIMVNLVQYHPRKGGKVQEKAIEKEVVAFNIRGSFFKYFSTQSHGDPVRSQLSQQLKLIGDFSPVTYTWFPANHREFNFNSYNDRLIASLFLLGYNEPMK
ncbi:hypothetical protein EYV94_02030 [Puteibacter caeruleilacunae]|nr:hypothetical protein EYV94_02030 [Puteibacter caeruleilacunae]